MTSTWISLLTYLLTYLHTYLLTHLINDEHLDLLEDLGKFDDRLGHLCDGRVALREWVSG